MSCYNRRWPTSPSSPPFYPTSPFTRRAPSAGPGYGRVGKSYEPRRNYPRSRPREYYGSGSSSRALSSSSSSTDSGYNSNSTRPRTSTYSSTSSSRFSAQVSPYLATGWNREAMHYDPMVYQPGLIIKIPYHQPTDARTAADEPFASRTRYGEVYSKLRMMVVTEVYENHCVCVPIYSHRGKGIAGKKPGKGYETVSIRDADDPDPELEETKFGVVRCRALSSESREELGERLSRCAARSLDAAEREGRAAHVRKQALGLAAPPQPRAGRKEKDGGGLAVSGKSSICLTEKTSHNLQARAQLVGYLDDKSLVLLVQLLNFVTMNAIFEAMSVVSADARPVPGLDLPESYQFIMDKVRAADFKESVSASSEDYI
ncbi:hypothetical protein MKZ38_001478 [Zalerion maritima]|uniref:DUF6590 domain-containing protein n=1 Tax=Zalerion maritima TaxID=339359 RepID=A0AAD5S5G0_9PEZI|nr:hypothetical protein MKZ38_001478 [Zalerion maritima]